MEEIKTTTKDGFPLKVGNIPVPEKMFFYQRNNGSIFNVAEKDAARIHKKFTYIGMTDGMGYMNTILELQQNFQNLTIVEIQEKMREAWRKEMEKSKQNKTFPQMKRINLNLEGQIDLPNFKDIIY